MEEEEVVVGTAADRHEMIRNISTHSLAHGQHITDVLMQLVQVRAC